MRIGIDLGGTKIEGIALDEKGRELIRHRVATPSGDYQATLNSIVELVNFIQTSIKCSASVGIGTPGSLSPLNNLLRNSNSVCMNGQPVKDDLQKLLGREIRITNDANCFALSEAIDGAAKGENVVFGVIIGTGTGAGIVVNGSVLQGANSIAGEWGHNHLPWPEKDEIPGPECYCGKRGCIETFLSGPGLSRDYHVATGNTLTALEIAERANSGDRQANTCLQRYENRLARGLAHIINILDPNVIVLGGGMSNIKRLYKNVPDLLPQHVFSDVVSTRLVAPVYGDSSGVRGAAWLWGDCGRVSE
jgi:fructokinase